MEQQKLESAQTAVGSRSADKIKRSVIVGSVWESKNCGSFEVLHYRNNQDVLVRFLLTGFEVNTSADQVRRGLVKDKLKPSAYGVGFNGVGDFKQYINNKRTKASTAWTAMLQRCYSDKLHARCPTYADCTVCSEWHNFQNFAKWFYENYPNDGSSYELDKDLKVIGNKVYSPETCMFVSSGVNNFILVSNVKSGDFMVGVSFHKSTGKFRATCKNPITGIPEHLCTLDCELRAHLTWRKRKSELAYELAMVQDRDEVKQALLNWKRALDNFDIHKIKEINQ
ncbi:DNA-binding domain protein [Vibrio phage vB_VnaS-L3]|nr:DNA-binding domain protein [Vibrio phage vB_VnaS-L3]